jgi:hypothetical protein
MIAFLGKCAQKAEQPLTTHGTAAAKDLQKEGLGFA